MHPHSDFAEASCAVGLGLHRSLGLVPRSRPEALPWQCVVALTQACRPRPSTMLDFTRAGLTVTGGVRCHG